MLRPVSANRQAMMAENPHGQLTEYKEERELMEKVAFVPEL